uniref:Uncharacterized protein n=1 Tax=Strongyloides papillosus TaxID=174720 RepID=A0A0N5CAV6_STREA
MDKLLISLLLLLNCFNFSYSKPQPSLDLDNLKLFDKIDELRDPKLREVAIAFMETLRLLDNPIKEGDYESLVQGNPIIAENEEQGLKMQKGLSNQIFGKLGSITPQKFGASKNQIDDEEETFSPQFFPRNYDVYKDTGFKHKLKEMFELSDKKYPQKTQW